MRRLLPLAFIIAVGLIPLTAPADTKPAPKTLPLAVVFALTVGEQQAPSDSEAVVAVIDRLKATGLVDVLSFNPDLPVVARAVLERRLDQETLRDVSDPKKAVRIASALGAQYAVQIRGSVTGSKVSISLQLTRVSGEGWPSAAEGEIAQGGGRQDVNRSNAIRTAASSAVSQAVIGAFGQDAVLGSAKPIKTNPASSSDTKDPVTTATGDPRQTTTRPAKKTEEPRDAEAEYAQLAKQIAGYVAKNDLPNAITALRRAINLKPDEPTLRTQLAQIYSDMGMTVQAVDECKRALLFNKDSVPIHTMLARLYEASDAPDEAIAQYREVARLDAQNPDVRLKLGDMYWNLGKIDDAASAYNEAAKLAPDKPGPHERLQRLYAARKMYTEMLGHLLQVKLLGAGAGTSDSGRYEALAQIIQDEFRTVLGKLETAGRDFGNNKIAREDYYKECKDSSARADAVAGFLSTQTAPQELKEAHSHGVLAANLLAQAAGYMVSYLETEKQYYVDQASLLEGEAKTELTLFTGSVRKT